MSLRPQVAHWFELLTSREELGATLDCLAQTGSVQLQAYSRSESRLALPDLRHVLNEYETLARRHAAWWPQPHFRAPDPQQPLTEVPQKAIERLRAWARDADPAVAELEHIAQSRGETQLLQQLQQAGGDALPQLDRLAAAGPVLGSRVYMLPTGGPPLSLPATVISQSLAANDATFLVAVGAQSDMGDLDQALMARKGRVVGLPADLPAGREALRVALEQQQRALDERERSARTTLAALSERHAVADALGEISLAAWVVAHVPELPVTEHFAWVTGWCADRDARRLQTALDARELHYLLRFTAAPEGEVPPSVLRNPRWARPFEVFTRLMGVPASGEADPSIVVALLAPLMFGFMFGDVAQGLVIALAGWMLRTRLSALRLLVPGGLVAVVFGLAFGSVFAREDVIAGALGAPARVAAARARHRAHVRRRRDHARPVAGRRCSIRGAASSAAGSRRLPACWRLISASCAPASMRARCGCCRSASPGRCCGAARHRLEGPCGRVRRGRR